jgi:hypothetical protein
MRSAKSIGRCVHIVSALLLTAAAARAQEKPPAPASPPAAPGRLSVGPFDLSVNWRSRLELWDWFEGSSGNNDYGFGHSLLRVAIGQRRGSMSWQFEIAQPAVIGLPDDAVAPPPLGQLGMGASYYVANDEQTNDAAVSVKQAFVQFERLGRSTLKLGRFEFTDGLEVRIPDPSVSAVVQTRIARRLIFTFAFPVGQRSFDGGQFSWNAGPNNVTVFAARPTEGGFEVEGLAELDMEVYYAAYNRAVKASRGAGAFRAFAVGYVDHRTSVLKTDNRPAAARQADRESIALGAFGANYVHVFEAGAAGKLDLLGWLSVQAGEWGTLSHRGAAFASEVGWQPPVALSPWFRAGYYYASGDGDPLDERHGTHYQVLGGTRFYARFPFYNMINNEDVYGMVTVRPKPTLTLKSELHGLTLTGASDLWYTGGGPFQASTFGHAGRPSFGARSLSTVWDVSVDSTITPHFSLGVYFGHAWGGDVIKGSYSSSADGSFGFVESIVRF